MTRRSRGREVALQVLYQVEQNAHVPLPEVRRFIQRRLLGDRKLCEFAEGLIAGVKQHQARIDALISEAAENWRLDRMAAIDRNILRLGAYEMMYCHEIPARVAINEALELAKRYSTAQSSRFVNGILDRVLQSQAAASRPAPDPEPTSPGPGVPAPEPVEEPRRRRWTPPNPGCRRMRSRPSNRPATAQQSGSPASAPRGADLHVHTTHSDGACSPCEVVVAAARVGLSALAITDHDTVSALAVARPEARHWGIELVTGVELTCEHRGRELHLLGYFIREDEPDLAAAMDGLRAGRARRIEAMAERLAELGLRVDLDAVRRAFPRAVLGRRHLADYLARTGQVSGMRDAFARYLGDGVPGVRREAAAGQFAGHRLDRAGRRCGGAGASSP